MKALLGLLIMIGLTGCIYVKGTTGPEISPSARPNTPVTAPFNKTWNTVIDYFTTSNIPISVIDRSSGLIVTRELWIGEIDASKWADCGKDMNGEPFSPAYAIYNVVVRGDSVASTVRTTTKWFGRKTQAGPTADYYCVSRGVWESDLDRDLKAQAEGRTVITAAPTIRDTVVTTPATMCQPGEQHSASHGHDFCWRNVNGTYQWVEIKRDKGSNP